MKWPSLKAKYLKYIYISKQFLLQLLFCSKIMALQFLNQLHKMLFFRSYFKLNWKKPWQQNVHYPRKGISFLLHYQLWSCSMGLFSHTFFQATILSTLYRQRFCTKVFCTTFLYLHFVFVTFGGKEIGAKAARKMLVKLTTSFFLTQECI
jgi:hypothetical protein